MMKLSAHVKIIYPGNKINDASVTSNGRMHVCTGDEQSGKTANSSQNADVYCIE